jgi:D-alanine-D-alanine ligase
MDLPYTGSGVLASALGMDKAMSKLLFRDHGLAVAEYRVFPRERAERVGVADLPFGLPAVVKPSGEGSSVGVHVVREPAGLPEACRDAVRYKGELVVERYVPGTEVQVAVLDGAALGAIEVVPSREFYDYQAKYSAGSTTYHDPARLPPDRLLGVQEAAERAHRALGCSGVTRSDFILTADGTPFILEVNTLPGMTATSLVPKIAAGNGISFGELCERILEGASLKG